MPQHTNPGLTLREALVNSSDELGVYREKLDCTAVKHNIMRAKKNPTPTTTPYPTLWSRMGLKSVD
jgi:hypothetical protein